MEGNIDLNMYAPPVPDVPPPPVPDVPPRVEHVVQQPVENDDIAGAPPPPPQQQEPLFIGPHNLVGPRLPPIYDIVANDPEIRRICSEISIFLSTNANNSYVIDYERSYNAYLFNYNRSVTGDNVIPPLSINEYRSKPTDTLFYPTTFIEPVKFFVRNAAKPNRSPMYNSQTAIATLEDSLNNTLSNANIERASSADELSRGLYFMPYAPSNPNKKTLYRSVQIPAGIPHLNPLYDILLKPGEGMIELNTARQYVTLILQLYRRIQAILVENGFQQGGKKKRRRTQKVNNKQSSKRRKVNSKQSKKRK